MKVGILTQPLHTNYGGLLQAFALQNILLNLGHEPITVDIPFRKKSIYQKYRGYLTRSVKKIILGHSDLKVIPEQPTKEESTIIRKYTDKFITENIELTEHIPLVEELNRLEKYNFDAFIVGSDQVWRPKYSPGIPAYFLNFVKNPNIKKISYAASFGTDEWEFNEKLTRTCRKLAQDFDAISVREESAVKLCYQYLGVKAQHHLDPAIMLDTKQYIELVERENIQENQNILMQYVLDESKDKLNIVNSIKEKLSLDIHSVMPERKFQEGFDNVEQCIYPKVTEWIRGFMDAEYVVTDSFHGTLFSIMFNKPFISLANSSRGITRFSSILKIFGLEDRLILPGERVDYDMILNQEIDYNRVNQILNSERLKAIKFLNSSLEYNESA